MNPDLLQTALMGVGLLVCIGIVFGIALAIAAHKFKVEADPMVEKVLHSLPLANCGGCGYPGCEGYARAVCHNPDVPPNLCFPGKDAVAAVVAEITGKKMAARENKIASIRCSRLEGCTRTKHKYVGFETCQAANMAFGGESVCRFACIGLGDCERACPFKAIEMVNGFPEINPKKCVGCGACSRHCPKQVIDVHALEARVHVPCSSKDIGKAVKDVCEVGCVGCRLCVKSCPANAVSYVNDLIVIDHHACLAYGDACGEACVAKCPRKIFRKIDSKQPKMLPEPDDKDKIDVVAMAKAASEKKSAEKAEKVEIKKDSDADSASKEKKANA